MKTLLTILALAGLIYAGPTDAETESAVPVIEWNRTILEIAEAEDRFLTLKGVRTAAMAHLAMHDSLAAINGRYQSYAHQANDPKADPLAAMVQAAFTVAMSQYPDRRETLEALRDRHLDGLSENAARRAGAALGEAAAHTLLGVRNRDGWNTEAEYQWHPMGPGVYAEFNEHSGTPEGFVFGAGWAKAKPFALESPDQFRSPPPPEPGSEAYTHAYEEVRKLGRFQTMERTADQTHLALWWKDFVENSHNRLARDLVIREALDATEAARLFALINMSVFDAYVSVFDNKFHYNYWRPYTAIRWADNDGNPDTKPEPTWNNTHRHTYAFPSYPSAHGCACAAAMSAIMDVFGEDYAFTMRNPQVDIAGPMSEKIAMHPPTRSFETPMEAATQCGLSRLYLGIHFRFDSTAGVDLGRQVGSYVVGNYLTRQGGD
ncbi:vanadium-dependent haloperoxidase [Wenzhouxiangella sp. XN201]|uniref:vanadium-dependent haloperoxidase n=1 Tax=Wenzhouxiangella sp. XN201 TaxID=2710755 RepID=UPI0013C5F70E|nr:vanadium-dependent haloperoxidase [Wenzhouxiangella sp. XN201]NEZ04928.1 vanadium-dependent haloperoxidase [Wenzhouxiangella sp. XN201]